MKPQYEVKNALTDRINGRLATAEEKIDEFKDIAVETTQNVLQKKKKKPEFFKEVLSDLQDNFKQPNIYVIGIPKGSGVGEGKYVIPNPAKISFKTKTK